MSEILPGVHRIESTYAGRWLAVHLLTGERPLLIDSGFAPTAEEVILPYLALHTLPVSGIRWLVITHASGDHFGGSGAIKRHSPGTQIVAHERDAGAIASHAAFITEHIATLRDDGVPVPEMRADDPAFRALHGPETPVDWIVHGGEALDLGGGRSVALLHAPGHTSGHLLVYDPANRALFIGDALMGEGIPDTRGCLVMPPHYFEVDWYRRTIETVRRLEPQHLLAAHYPPIEGRQVREFLEASEGFVARFEALLADTLRRADGPMDLPALIEAARARLNIPEADYQYGMLVRAHLRALARAGRASAEHWDDRLCWRRMN